MRRMRLEEMHRGRVLLFWDDVYVATMTKGIGPRAKYQDWRAGSPTRDFPSWNSHPCLLLACRRVLRMYFETFMGEGI